MKMGYFLIVVGIVLTISGGVLVYGSKNPESKAQMESPTESPAESQEVIAQEVIAESPAPQSDEKSAKEKGNEFEGYIADILKQNGINIKEWNQGSVSPNGAIAQNALNPDFFVEQPGDKFPLEYWIEAKWRNSRGERFSLDQEQFSRYKETQRSSKRKIILALGFEGSPAAPKSVYFVPLDSLSNGQISFGQLKHFYLSNPGRDFKNRMDRWFKNEVFKKKN